MHSASLACCLAHTPGLFRAASSVCRAAAASSSVNRRAHCVQWVPDAAPGHVVKIDNANQFAPVGSNPKELRHKFYEVCTSVMT